MTQKRIAIATLSLLVGVVGFTAWQRASAVDSSNVIAQASPDPQAECRSRRQIDFSAAAAELNISETELRTALGIAENQAGRPRRLDIPAAAAALNISEEQLVEALGIPPRPPRPDFAAAAAQLNVTEDALKAALGIPDAAGDRSQRPRRPDFAAAAQTLGVTEEQLIEALGIPARPDGGDRPTNP